MVKVLLASLLVFAATAFAKTDCHDIKSVTSEAIAYSLVGAWEPFTTHACFKNEKFLYFRPQLGTPRGEVTAPEKLLWFDKSRDKYTIESVKADGKDYTIAVRFHIGNKDLLTHYTYRPKPDYNEKTGICGYVVNYEHGIFRKDCLVPSRLPSSLKKK